MVASLLLIFERLHVGFFFCFFQVTLQGSLLVPVLPAGRGGLLHFSCFGHLVRGVEGFILLLWPLLRQAEGEGRVVIFDTRAVNSKRSKQFVCELSYLLFSTVLACRGKKPRSLIL